MGETESRSSLSKVTQVVFGTATLRCRWKAHFSRIKSVHHQHRCHHYLYYTVISFAKSWMYCIIVLSGWPVSRGRSSIYAEESAWAMGLLERFQAVPSSGLRQTQWERFFLEFSVTSRVGLSPASLSWCLIIKIDLSWAVALHCSRTCKVDREEEAGVSSSENSICMGGDR